MFFIYHLFIKPILGAFAAVFIFVLEKSELIFSINPIQNTLGNIITINVPPDSEGYVYAILAVSSGFAGDKILRSTIGKVLERLEDKAEKNKETPNG
ncbi:MAG: hypothetical protein AB1630_07430 [bacterium]